MKENYIFKHRKELLGLQHIQQIENKALHENKAAADNLEFNVLNRVMSVLEQDSQHILFTYKSFSNKNSCLILW